MEINYWETYKDDVALREITCDPVQFSSRQRVSGFMPEVHPRVTLAVGDRTSELKYTALPLLRLYYVPFEGHRIESWQNLWSNKITFRWSEPDSIITIQSPYTFFGRKLSEAQLLFLNNERLDYSIKPLSQSIAADQTPFSLSRQDYKVGLLRSVDQKRSFDVQFERPFVMDEVLNAALTILVFEILRTHPGFTL